MIIIKKIKNLNLNNYKNIDLYNLKKFLKLINIFSIYNI